MDKIAEAQQILKSFGMPELQQNKISALTLLALCNIKPEDSWGSAMSKSMTLSKDIIDFVTTYYVEYKASSRESFRRNALKPFVAFNIVELNPDNPNLAANSSNTHYAISFLALNTIKKFNTPEWDLALDNFLRYVTQNPDKKDDATLLRIFHISSYKSIVDDTINLGRFNVFIGANGCGKTNILEALAVVGADRAGDVTYDGLYSRGVRMARPDLILSSFLDSNQASIDIDLSFESATKKFDECKCSLTPVNIKDPYTKWINLAEEELYPEIILEYFGQIIKTDPGISGNSLLEKANELIANKGLKKIRNFDTLLSEYAIFDLNTKSLRGISQIDSKKTPLGLNGEGLDLLITNFDSYERSELNKCLSLFDWLSEIIADKDDKFKLMGLKPGRSASKLYFRDKFMQKDNNTLSAENSNEGVLHVLFYLALFISSKTPKLFGIDNIETALNPRLCRSVISKLAEISKETGKQALITTHNPAILDGLNLLDEDQRLFEVYRNSEGKTKTKRIKFKSDLSNKQYKLSEMWLNGTLGAVPQNF